MALQIITGPSGGGKTYYTNHLMMEEAISHPDRMYYVVVPEQLNLSMQQKFLEISPTHTLFNIDVVSFERLAERIISRCGMQNPVLVDDTGKCLLLRKVAGDVRNELTVFKRPIAKPGFIQLLKSALSELLQYDITEQKLAELSETEKMPAGLSGKLRDMCLLYKAFNDAMEEGIPKESLLSYVNGLLPNAEHIKQSVFLFDGFTGFTPLQEKLLESLMSLSQMVYVTVTMDREALNDKEVDNFDLFYMSHVTMNGLYRCAERAKTKVLSPVIFDKNRRSQKSDLLFLEKNIFRKKHVFYEDAPESIHFMEMGTPLDETRCVAEEIYSLLSKGYRYREIAVITGNMDTYIPHISRVFTQAGFTYYMDNKKDIHDMPVVCYLLYAMDTVRRNADYESMFTFLKTGIILSQEECSILENYVLAKGIRGFALWKKEWKKEIKNMNGYTLQQVNAIREKAIKNLLPFKDILECEEATVKDVLTGLVTMMQNDDVFGYIEGKRKWYTETSNTVWENLYEQLYAKVMEVFDQFVQTLGNKKLTVAEYYDVLLAGFSEIKAGTIPVTSDCILIGDMERTRVEDIKVLFFMGLNEGNIPTLDSKIDLLNKQDREILSKEYEVELTPTLETKQSFQKYYFYLTITKPSERLYLTYPETDNQGSGLNPSSYLREIRQLFPEIMDTYEMPGKYYINDKTMLDMFAVELRVAKEKGISQRFKNIAGALWSREQNRDMMAGMIERTFFNYQPESLGADYAKALYGETITTSATRLEKVAGCPFSHFIQYGMNICERDVFEVTQKDIGSIYHMVLERFFKETSQKDLNWLEMSSAERNEQIHACMETIAETYKDSLFRSTAKNRYYSHRICTVISNTVGVLAKQVEQAGYTVKEVEIAFSGQESSELDITLDNDSKMIISGRVDRLDIKTSDENVLYAKVIDYKTGNTSFDATLAYNGLGLQLIYMDAVMGIVKKEFPDMDVRSGGFAYFHVKDHYVETDGMEPVEELERKMMKEMEMTGLINSAAEPGAKDAVDETTLYAIRNHIRGEAQRVGNKIVNGDVEISPFKRKDQKACTFCPYKAICGFDTDLMGFNYRMIKEVTKKDFLEE